MLKIILDVNWLHFLFQERCISNTAGLRAKRTPKSLCYLQFYVIIVCHLFKQRVQASELLVLMLKGVATICTTCSQRVANGH